MNSCSRLCEIEEKVYRTFLSGERLYIASSGCTQCNFFSSIQLILNVRREGRDPAKSAVRCLFSPPFSHASTRNDRVFTLSNLYESSNVIDWRITWSVHGMARFPHAVPSDPSLPSREICDGNSVSRQDSIVNGWVPEKVGRSLINQWYLLVRSR